MRRKIELLHRYCAEIGRDPSSITCTVSVMLDPDEDVDRISGRLTAYRQAGVDGVVLDLAAPYDLALLGLAARARSAVGQ